MRKFIYLFTSFVALALFMVQSSFAADPNDFRSPNMWERERTINDAINKSSVKVEASKTYPVSTLDQNGKPIKQIRTAKSTITLGAKTSNIGKTLMKRAPITAIGYAVTAILGRAVDWVLDPENNRVKYKDGDSPKYIYKTNGIESTKSNSANASCSIAQSIYGKPTEDQTYQSVNTDDNGNIYCPVDGSGLWDRGLPVYKTLDDTPVEPSDWQYIYADELANKVIEHAVDGQAPAMQVMSDSALDSLNSGDLDASLDAASDIPQPDPNQITQEQYDNPDYPATGTGTGTGTGTENPTDGEDGEDGTDGEDGKDGKDAEPFELPAFCDWASKVCDFIDWVQTEPSDGDGDGDIQVEQPDPDMHVGILERLYIDMPAACPADPILEFMGAKIPFPMSIFCQFAEMMKPLILLFAYIKGLSIIGNGLT